MNNIMFLAGVARRFSMLMVVLLSLAANAQNKYTIQLSIKDQTGNQITDATARILNQTVLPQQNKDGTLVIISSHKGTTEIHVVSDGYAARIIRFELERDTSLNIVLERSYQKLDEVVISAEKKETSLYDVATSVSYINGKQANEMRLWKIADLSGVAPNTVLSNSGDSRNVTGIRGLVTTSYEQAVATYIDGVAQFNLDTYIPQLHDIEGIEVIRGAQGTLYGRNAMGGIVNITTKKPQNKTDANVSVQIGNYGQKRATGAFRSALIKDKLWASFSFLRDSRNGYYTNDFTGNDYDSQRQNMFNVQLRYQMRNGWSAQLDIKQYVALNDGAFPLVADLKEAIEKPYRLTQNNSATMNDRSRNASIVIKHSGSKVNLSMQTAIQNNYRFYDKGLDADFSQFDIISIYNNYGKDFNKVSVLTNELRISSTKNTLSTLEWNAGLFHFMQQSPTKQATVFGKNASFIGVPDNNFSLIAINRAQNNGLAGYGQVKYAINKQWKLEGGFRIDAETKKMTVRSEYEKPPTPAFVTRPDTAATTQFSAFSPRMALHYSYKENQLMYLSYSRGFRTGGLSGIGSDPSQLPLVAYRPEYSNMFEMGAKGINASNTFRYGFALFYNTVTDVQAPQLLLPDAVTITRNAGRMNAYGLEAEMLYKPINGLTVQYSMGSTKAQYTSLKGVSDGSEINLDGKMQVFTPASTHFLSTQYQTNLGKHTLLLRIEYKFTGDQYFDLKNIIQQKGYGLVNARVAFQVAQFEFSAWGRNLTGKKYFSYAYDFGAAHLGEPRLIGGGIGWKL